jgi:hypothetical protein
LGTFSSPPAKEKLEQKIAIYIMQLYLVSVRVNLMSRFRRLLFNSSESLDFLFTGLLIYAFVQLLEYLSPAIIADIPSVYFTGLAIIFLVIVLQLGSLPFIRSNLFRLLNINDEVDLRFNISESFEKKNFIIKSGTVTKIFKDIPPQNFSGHFLLDNEKYWLASIQTETGDLCTVPLDFVFKIRP